MDTENKRKGFGLRNMILLGLLLVITIGAAIWWWHNYNKYITTDDANLDSYTIAISPEIMSKIVALHVEEGDSVKKGMLLIELDSSTFVAQLNEAFASKKQLEDNLQLEKANLNSTKRSLELDKLSGNLAKTNYERANRLLPKGAVSVEEFQARQETYAASQVQIKLAEDQISVAQAQIKATESAIAKADAAIESILVQLGYCKIVAPEDGIIAKRWMYTGDVAQPGQTIFTINKGKDIWLSIYLEETKFENIFIGQEVQYTLDAFNNVTFKGKIFYIGSNAASEFSLIPPNNASGNYTKVTQRIPIKISIDSIIGKKENVEKVKLVSGMSANVKIIK